MTREFGNPTLLQRAQLLEQGVALVRSLQAGVDDICETSVKDRGGQYQGHADVKLPKV